MKPPSRNRNQAGDWWNGIQCTAAAAATKPKRGTPNRRKQAPAGTAVQEVPVEQTQTVPAATEEQAAATLMALAQAAAAHPTNMPTGDNRLAAIAPSSCTSSFRLK